MKNFAKTTGFTLIEFMVTLAILAILVSLGVPAMNEFMNRNRLTSHTKALHQALLYARSESVAKNLDVVICASTDATSCSGNADDWAQGWIVFTDRNGNVSPDVGDGDCDPTEDCLMKQWGGLSANFSLAGDAASIVFNSDGERSAGATVFRMCDAENSTDDYHSATLSVNAVGWVTVSEGVTACP